MISPPRLSVWPTLPPLAYARPERKPPPFPLEDERCALFSRARHALFVGVRELGLVAGDVVLAPAYHHGSEIAALVEAGIEPRYYAGDGSLAPDADELDRLLDDRVRALLLTHYLGFPQDAARWRAWCDERGLLLVEDAAQSWLARTDAGALVGSFGDLSIFCLYKSVGVPDGAALVLRALDPVPAAVGRGEAAVAKRHVAWVAGRSGVVAAAAARAARERAFTPAEDFALGVPHGPLTLSVRLVRRLAGPDVAAARRAHYGTLAAALGEHVPQPFGEVPDGASPWGCPVEVDGKAETLARLARAGVRAIDFWSVPHPSLEAERFPAAAARRARTLLLPVHQELRTRDVERIADAVVPGRVRERALRFEPIELDDPGWSALAAATGNVFVTPEWAATWWRHFGDGSRLLLRGARDAGGELVAVLPLCVAPLARVPVARFLGHGPGDQLGPVCAPRLRRRVAAALRGLLREERIPLLLAEQTAVAEGWRAHLDATPLTGEGSPVLRFPGGDWDAYLATRSSNLRQRVRYTERKLARDHEVRFRLATAETLARDLDALFALHEARWSGGETAFGPDERFHREFAALALERGWLRLWVLDVDGAPVAAWYGLRYGDAESYYQAGRDPEWDRHSVGFVLVAHTMRAAREDGMREYRFLRGDEPFKYRFATHDDGLETLGVSRVPGGGAVLAVAAAARRRLR